MGFFVSSAKNGERVWLGKFERRLKREDPAPRRSDRYA
jgi:hypothetical protein